MQIKIFESMFASHLERDVNKFCASHKVIDIKYSVSQRDRGHDFIYSCCVIYSDGDQSTSVFK